MEAVFKSHGTTSKDERRGAEMIWLLMMVVNHKSYDLEYFTVYFYLYGKSTLRGQYDRFALNSIFEKCSAFLDIV